MLFRDVATGELVSICRKDYQLEQEYYAEVAKIMNGPSQRKAISDEVSQVNLVSKMIKSKL